MRDGDAVVLNKALKDGAIYERDAEELSLWPLPLSYGLAPYHMAPPPGVQVM